MVRLVPLYLQYLARWPKFPSYIKFIGLRFTKGYGNVVPLCFLEGIHLLTSSCHQFLREVPKHLEVGTFKTRAQGEDLFAILETKKSC